MLFPLLSLFIGNPIRDAYCPFLRDGVARGGTLRREHQPLLLPRQVESVRAGTLRFPNLNCRAVCDHRRYAFIYALFTRSHTHIYIYIHICIYVYIYIYIYACIHVNRCIYISIHLSIFPSIFLSIYQSINLSIYLSICLSALSIYLSICIYTYERYGGASTAPTPSASLRRVNPRLYIYRLIYKEHTSTHALGTDPRVTLNMLCSY